MVSTLALAFICMTTLGVFGIIIDGREKRFMEEREQWNLERKDLLDRIQAPTFAQYTHKVIAEKKAEQPEEPKVEPEFVS